MLIRITRGDKPHGYLIWQQSQNWIDVRQSGAVLLKCGEVAANATSLVGENAGTSSGYGQCVDVFVSENSVSTLLDIAVRTDATFVMICTNPTLLGELDVVWADRQPLGADDAAVAIDMMSVVAQVGQELGQRLKKRGIEAAPLKHIARENRQWSDDKDGSYDHLSDCFKDAVNSGWEGELPSSLKAPSQSTR